MNGRSEGAYKWQPTGLEHGKHFVRTQPGTRREVRSLDSFPCWCDAELEVSHGFVCKLWYVIGEELTV